MLLKMVRLTCYTETVPLQPDDACYHQIERCHDNGQCGKAAEFSAFWKIFLNLPTRLSFVLAYKNISEAGYFSPCLPSLFPNIKNKGWGGGGTDWFGEVGWQWGSGWIKLHSMGGSSASMSSWICSAFELGVLLSLTTFLRNTKNWVFNLPEIKPEKVHLIKMHSTCQRMTGGTGKFRPHLIPSLLSISLSERKKDKNKTLECQFKLLALYREKLLCFAPQNCSSRANESWRYLSSFTRKCGLQSG